MSKKLLFSLIAAIVAISVLILITCTPLPSDPYDDPTNLEVKIAPKDTSTLYTGKKTTIALDINIPKFLKTLEVNFGEGAKDTTIEYTNQAFTSSDILYVTCIYDTTGQKNITAVAYLTNGATKQFYGVIKIATSSTPLNGQIIKFDTIAGIDTMAVGALDSLRFVAHTEPKDSSISYSVSSSPVVSDTAHLKVKSVNKVTGSTATVYFTPPDTGKYTITLKAQSGSAVDSQKVVVYAFKAPEFSIKPADSTDLTIGKADTLVFAVDKELYGSAQLQFKNQSDFKAGTVTVVSSQTDTLKIVFTPDEAKKYTFIVAVAEKQLSTTIQVIRNVLDPSSFWKQSSITVNAVEGIVLQKDLKTNLNDTTVSGVTYTTDKGEMSGNTLTYTVPVGKTADTLNITSQYKGVSSKLQVVVQISAQIPFWKQPSIALNAMEGTLLQQDLSAYFSDATVTGVTYSISKGEVSGNTFKYTIPSGITSDTLKVTSSLKGKAATLQVIISISAELPFWKQTSAIISGVEGILLQQNLASFLTDSTITGVTYVTSKGQINGRLVSYTAPFGKTADTLGVTATRTGKSPAQIELIVQITSGDSSKPSITRKTPSSDDFKSSASQVTCEYTITDEGAGVGKVVFSIGDSVLTDTTHTGNVYGCTIKNLAKGQKTTVTVVAKDASIKKNSTSASVSITYDPTMTDNIGPKITFITKDSSKVSSPSKSIDLSCTDSSGIASLSYLFGAAPVNVPKNTDGTFTANVSGLTKGWNVIVFTATDGSVNANVSKDTIIIFYDPTMEDTDPPTVNLKNPANADQRVETDSIVVKIACSDLNGIASVTATRAGKAVSVTGPEADSLYSAVVTKLTPGGSDTVKFIATDKSTKANSKPFTVVIRYNRKPNAATLSTPAANATGITLKPTLTWADGTDPDGDAVTYTLKYGTTQTNLNQSKTGLTAKQYTLATDLTAATDYYWQVMTTTANGDSALSEVHKFTTIETPDIVTDPENKTVKVGNTATFSITAKGTNLKYEWQKGGSKATTGTGITTESYTTAATSSGDDGSAYRCVVTNDGGADTSAVVTLTIAYSVSYDGNLKTGGTGTAPTDDKIYPKNETVTVKQNTGSLNISGYKFEGWNTKNDGTGTNYEAGTGTFKMGSANIILYAQWSAVPYNITYNLNGGTNSGSNPSNYTIETATINLAGATKTGNIFGGWYSASDLSGTAITSITKGSTGNKILYAKWLPAFKVTYDANGGGISWGHGSSGVVPTDSKEYAAGNTVTVLGNTGNLNKYAYSFDGWSRTKIYTISEEPVTSFQIGSKNDTLYARWVIKDASGNKYDEVQMPGGVWMLQNLRTTKFNDGSDIPLWNVGGGSEIAKYYPGDQIYGAYYNGYAAALDTNHMLAPPGWHIVKNLEYAEFQYGTQGIAKDLASKEYWKTGSSTNNAPGQQPSLNNSSGFSAIPSGYFNGSTFQRGEYAEFWMNNFTTNEYYTSGQTMYLNWDDGQIHTQNATMTDYHSVRCIRDF